MIFMNRFDMVLSLVYGYYLIHGCTTEDYGLKDGIYKELANKLPFDSSSDEIMRAFFMLVEVGALIPYKKHKYTINPMSYSYTKGAPYKKLYRLSAIGYIYAIENNFFKDQNQDKLNLSSIVTDDPKYVNEYILDKFSIVDFSKFVKDNEDPTNSARIVGLNYNL